ncbi:hypothetical protein MMF93_24610 [Streptomyces tubbatahanensis]|uniref:Integral membrane protein n=1 Tax=Streptomyces tubbatahanensis TaxID=2923272 RepID=A0ABY3XXM9_9ACTN|nr:hypothetical protein [Streptomyces tubbatahanensis]UNS99282.1 hypothetical protein MMF93_24610 [Streptomyces tubbatahanensis]
MLTLRLTLWASPLALLLRLLLVCASAGVGLLLLNALSYAVQRPSHPTAALPGLLWCLIPLAVTAHLAAALVEAEPSAPLRSGLDAAGLGPVRLPLLLARMSALPCAVGGGLALLATVWGQGGADDGAPAVSLPGTAAELPLAQEALPLPAAVTLLSAVPVVAALAAARTAGSGTASAGAAPRDRATSGRRSTGTAALVAGLVLAAAGLLLAASAVRAARHSPETARTGSPGAAELASSPLAAGWLLTALGLVLAGPALTSLAGRVLTAGRPGAVRLLAGEALVRESALAGRPLAALGMVGAAALVVVRARLAETELPAWGPAGTLAAVLVACCLGGVALAAMARARRSRAPLALLLERLGASRGTRRAVAAVRVAVVASVVTALTLVAGLLAPLPSH